MKSTPERLRFCSTLANDTLWLDSRWVCEDPLCQIVLLREAVRNGSRTPQWGVHTKTNGEISTATRWSMRRMKRSGPKSTITGGAHSAIGNNNNRKDTNGNRKYHPRATSSLTMKHKADQRLLALQPNRPVHHCKTGETVRHQLTTTRRKPWKENSLHQPQWVL